MRSIFIATIAATLTACGGGGGDPDGPYVLVMEKADGQTETIAEYESAHDCQGAGSYRVATQPSKYVAFKCKEK